MATERLIHPTAVIDSAAQLHETVSVGPFAVVGPHVRIGARTSVGAHCVIDGITTIGEDNVIHAHAALGGAPQDKKYANEPTRLEIGNRNTIREFCTFNCGTVQDEGVTRVGDDNWIMAYVHIAHDCRLGNQTILANNATLAGHVHVDDWAIIGGLTGVHQFTRVGAHVMAGFSSHISQDVPPFMMVDGNPLTVRGLNLEGLRRRGFGPERLAVIKQAYRLLYRSGLTLQASVDALHDLYSSCVLEAQGDVQLMIDFLAQSKRGIVR